MLSQSARATSAAESRFRVRTPNSRPRAILVIAPGDRGTRLAPRGNSAVTVLGGGALTDQSWRGALHERDLDLVLLIGDADQLSAGIAALGEACRERGIKLSAILLGRQDAPELLRSWARTITCLADERDLAGLLEALGA